VSIIDLSGLHLGMWNSENIDNLKLCVKIQEENYPGLVGKCIAINTPMIFRIMWGVIKGWLDESRRRNTHLLSSDYMEGLLEYVDED